MNAISLPQNDVFHGNKACIRPKDYRTLEPTGDIPDSQRCTPSEPSDLSNAHAHNPCEKQYHQLEPVSKVGTADGVDKHGCPRHGFPGLVELACDGKAVTARRSRRLAKDDTVPLKKRKRVISPDLDDEYILPTHVQLEANKAAVAATSRRLRPKRAPQPIVSQLVDSAPASPAVSALLSKTEPKPEPVSDSEAAAEQPPPPACSPPPKRKRGRPRKSQMPQRLHLPTAAGESEAPLSTCPEAAALDRPPSTDEPVRRVGPGRPRRGRKSAAPVRRKMQRAVTPPPDVQAETQRSPPSPSPSPSPSRSASPQTDVLHLRSGRLPACARLTLTDRQLLLDLPTRRLLPCPHCSSLTSRPAASASASGDHEHAVVRSVEPRRRIRLVVNGQVSGSAAGARHCCLSDQRSGEVVGVTSLTGARRRGRRRGCYRSGAAANGGRELVCRICGKHMLSISRLKKHQLVHTDERPFNCDKCPKSFKSIHVLNAHQLTHINYRPFKCSTCQQTFAKKWTLRGHLSTHERQEGSDDLMCIECNCGFQDRSTYDSHMKIHTGERKWECKVCHRGFAKKLKLRKHMVVHSQAMLHKCHLCDREFRWKEKLVKHVMLHTGERPFKCNEARCVKSFRAHSDLNVHIRNVHKKQPKKLDYPIVKSEPKPNHCELLLMRVNEIDGIPPCDLCTQIFTSKDEYLNHIIPAHRDQEAYVCHPCKRVFDNKVVYDDHIEERHRRGEIMWRCQLCPKIFNKRALFEGHKTLHATKFQCKICFRFASDEKRLQVHIMNHRYTDIDNSSHACTICSRQFKLRFSLKNHMFKMHSIDLPSLRKPPMRKFECSICHARFVRPTPAYNHMVRVHDIRPEPEVQDMFDLTTLSVEHPESLNYPPMDPDDPSVVAALQNNIRIKVEAMAAQGMWDASEADGSTYLGGSAPRRRLSTRLAAGDAPPPSPPPAPPLRPTSEQLLRPPSVLTPQPASRPDVADDTVKTLLRLSPGKRSELVRVTSSPPPGVPAAADHQQQIIVIQQEGEEEIDLSRVLGGSAPADAQTLTMNADGVLVDDQGNPVSLMVEGGGAATHLLEYLRGSESVSRPG